MILVIDDDRTICLSLKLLLKRTGYEAMAVESPEKALDLVRSVDFQLILMDMNFSLATSGEEGLDLLQKVRIFCKQTPVILMTAWGSIPLAVEGMRNGAFDFITKPWDNRLLLQRVETALQLGREKKPEPIEKNFDRCGIIGQSQGLMNVLDTVMQVADTDASILIMGENGTGKELIAEAIHRNSRRSNAPFVKVNLGGISQSLFESEMFGYCKGAFTGAVSDRKGRFEMADNGTIFLDEIGDLDIACQVKILRVLQEQTFEALGDSRPKRVNLRVVCATNADLPKMVVERRFREDLFYRINLITVTLPPLRERRDDIPLLARHFAEKVCAANGYSGVEIRNDAMEFLSELPFPGNIRELRNLVERTLLVSGKDTRVLDADCFRRQYMMTPRSEINVISGITLEEREIEAIKEALKESGGNLSKVAVRLGVTRQTLYRRMAKYGLK